MAFCFQSRDSKTIFVFGSKLNKKFLRKPKHEMEKTSRICWGWFFYFHMWTKPERRAKNFELCATKHFSAPRPSAYASSEKRDLNARRSVERQTFHWLMDIPAIFGHFTNLSMLFGTCSMTHDLFFAQPHSLSLSLSLSLSVYFVELMESCWNTDSFCCYYVFVVLFILVVNLTHTMR